MHDLTDVADGLVEVTRAWAWRRLGRRMLWLPAELCQWEVVEGPHADLARAVIEERPAEAEPDVLAALLARSAAAGHHVHLARSP